MKVKEVAITGMHKVDSKVYELNDHITYFVGPNGAGKSTILEAIQLALLGYIPGYAKTNESIMKHASSPTLSVSLTLDEDIKITRTWMRSGASIKSNIDIQGYEGEVSDLLANIELPIFDFNEFNSMTANKLKEWFITFLPGEKGGLDLVDRLNKSAEERNLPAEHLLTDLEGRLAELSELNDIDKVKSLNTMLKEDQSYTKGKIAKLQGTIESLVYYDDAPVLDEEEIRKQLVELTVLKEDVIRYDTTLKMQSSLKANIEELKDCLPSDCLSNDNRISKMEAEIEELNNQLNEFQSAYKELNDKKTELVAKRSKLSVTSRSTCPYTQQECATISQWFDKNKEQAAELDKQIAEVDAKIKEIDPAQWKSKAAEKQQIASNIEFIRSQYSKLDALESQIVDVGERPSDKTIEQLNSEVTDLQNGLAKVIANKQYEELQEQVTKDKFALETDLEVFKTWIKLTDANGLQTELMNKPFENLADEMSRYLTSMFGQETLAKFNLISKANSFSFGLCRNNSYIEFDYLSSGEKCLFTLALLMCILDKSESQIRTILIDDILDHLDTPNASHLFGALTNVSDIQFILAGVKECEDTSICKGV